MRRTAPASADDVTQDTFLIALAKAGDLRDPERFRAWLYAIARNECLRVLRQSQRSAPWSLDEASIPAEGDTDMTAALDRREVADLVREAAEGLSPKDREVFDLGLRHDLHAREIADALGVSENVAHAQLSRVRAQLERSLGALLVARRGAVECASLQQVLSGWDGSYDALWRKRIARHVDTCATCTSTRTHELRPAALLGVLPLAAASPALREQLLGRAPGLRLVSADASDPALPVDLLARARTVAARAGAFDDEGFPTQPQPAARPRAVLATASTVLALLVMVGVGLALLRDDPPTNAPPPTEEPAARSANAAPSSEPTVTFGQPVAPRETLRRRPTEPSAAGEPTATPTADAGTAPLPSGSATTPTGAPSRTPTRRPPAPTTSPPPPASGTVAVTPPVLTLPRGGTGTVTLVAVGGAVSWRADVPPYLVVSPASGSLEAGSPVTVTVALSPATPRSVTRQVLRFSPGSATVTVTVD